MKISSWYIVRLFRESKWLFVGIALFCLMQLYFNIKKIHSFPWFVFDMYSKVESMPETVTQTQFFINGQHFNYMKMPFWSGITAVRCTEYYHRMQLKGWVDPNTSNVRKRLAPMPPDCRESIYPMVLTSKEEAERYPSWMMGYLGKYSDQEIKRLEAVRIEYAYVQGKFTATGVRDTILSIQNP
jgi:hypothetical protein